jgi:hypothetical protein
LFFLTIKWSSMVNNATMLAMRQFCGDLPRIENIIIFFKLLKIESIKQSNWVQND